MLGFLRWSMLCALHPRSLQVRITHPPTNQSLLVLLPNSTIFIQFTWFISVCQNGHKQRHTSYCGCSGVLCVGMCAPYHLIPSCVHFGGMVNGDCYIRVSLSLLPSWCTFHRFIDDNFERNHYMDGVIVIHLLLQGAYENTNRIRSNRYSVYDTTRRSS